MKITRRSLLTGTACIVGLGLSGCESFEQRLTPVPLDAQGLGTVPDATRITRRLNRATFGPAPSDVRYAAEHGWTAYVDAQIYERDAQEDPWLTARLRPLKDVIDADTALLFDSDDRSIGRSLEQAALLRAIYSKRQVYERMVHFWADHFNIYAGKGDGAQLKVADDANVVRAHAFGSFRDLLGASARSSAMLRYLDNAENRAGAPNENYARELLELHTLGIDGGYTQQDVHAAARCLTGWTVQTHWHRGAPAFRPELHDTGTKRVLGHTIGPDGGASELDQLLDVLGAHPATARHLTAKLCQHFVGAVPARLQAQLCMTFARTEGNIAAVVRQILLADDIVTGPPIPRRPWDFITAACRALAVDTDGGPALQQHLRAMGQPLFGWAMPDGYPETWQAWSGSLLQRWNFAGQLAGSEIENTTIPWTDWHAAAKGNGIPTEHMVSLALGIPLEHDMLETGMNAEAQTAMMLSAPAFQWR